MKNSRERICAIVLLCAAAAMTAPAQTFTSLVSFNGSNGSDPYNSPPVVGPNGNLYGTTLTGGTVGLGTVYSITPAGVLTTIYNFCSQNGCSDGFIPYGGIIVGVDGNLYGTTSGGGGNFGGTVFKIATATGVLTTLYNFCSQNGCTDGSSPSATLVQGPTGNFFGTTNSGGAHGSGTVFEITPSGILTTLYNFCSQTNCADGTSVFGALTRASNGKYYGVTVNGGLKNFGTVFSITASGVFTSVHSFGFTDGATPWGGLVQASDGNLYGTTSFGGRAGNGTAFKMSLSGRLRTIHSFCGSAYCVDGSTPLGRLTQGSNGDLYGTTSQGGASYLGSVFSITTTGTATVLHSFIGSDGANPYAGLALDPSNGTFYGTTIAGGDYGCTSIGAGCGTIFSLVP